jgi:hypothetical protein
MPMHEELQTIEGTQACVEGLFMEAHMGFHHNIIVMR